MAPLRKTLFAALAGSLLLCVSAFGQTDSYQCVLPYVSGGGMVHIVNASSEDQSVEITVMNAYWYDIVVPKSSSYSFQSPMYQYFFVPIVHGGPLVFKSAQPLVAYTTLQDSIAIQCSDPTKRTKIFVGGAKTGIAISNTTKSAIKVEIFQDAETTPLLSLTFGPEERRMGFLGEVAVISGTHSYRLVADSDGIGVAAVSYEGNAPVALPIAESPRGK